MVAEVAETIPFVFNNHHFMKSWKALKVRPETGASRPEATEEKYCVYDERHKDYGYTSAYVEETDQEMLDGAGVPRPSRRGAQGQGHR